MLLLNKADLLPAALRIAWADYFDRQEAEYVFWSAKAGIDSLTGQWLPHVIECLHQAPQFSQDFTQSRQHCCGFDFEAVSRMQIYCFMG